MLSKRPDCGEKSRYLKGIRGWCSDADDERLRVALDGRALHYLLRFTPAPEDSVPPSVLRNPAWVRPFEVFGRLMGVPGTREADPSIVLALVAPLMFGFMFGDVVQGFVVAVAGFLLSDRLHALRLLMPGGLVAVAFGLAFGSVFAREDVIPALWLHPLGEPLTVLGMALGFGVAVILVGLLLNALQARWRGELGHWFATDAGIVVAYLGAVGTALDARLLWALPAGLAWSLAGSALLAPADRLGALSHAAGETIERVLQLGVNTVSFVRLGAFALAHAGLSTAVVGIAEAAGRAYWPAHGPFVNKVNADVVQDEPTRKRIAHPHRDLHALGEYLIQRHEDAITQAGMEGLAFVGELPVKWQTDYNFTGFGGWLHNQDGREYERNILVVIPGKNRGEAVVMGDHYDTAYMEDYYYDWRGGDGSRIGAHGADDNDSATATLLQAAPIFLQLAKEGKLERDVWLLHLTAWCTAWVLHQCCAN